MLLQAGGFSAIVLDLGSIAPEHVSRIPLVGEFQAGFAVMLGGVRFTAVHVLRSAEFRGQTNGTFQFTSGSLSVKF